jgi:hypothetical protein
MSYYDALPGEIQIERDLGKDGTISYIARHPEFGSVCGPIGTGATPEEALMELREARRSPIQVLEQGDQVPEPRPLKAAIGQNPKIAERSCSLGMGAGPRRISLLTGSGERFGGKRPKAAGGARGRADGVPDVTPWAVDRSLPRQSRRSRLRQDPIPRLAAGSLPSPRGTRVPRLAGSRPRRAPTGTIPCFTEAVRSDKTHVWDLQRLAG